ncbi:MAG: hypothetical protein U0L05_05825 [Schaedlerella sp.]|nr:hypothetical protein [Schaedlerella sp.]
MFTVIIAEKDIVDMYKQFHMFLAPLENKNIVFCEWNRDGNSLEEMLPDLYKTIDLKSEWKAIIVSQDGMNKANPFNYTDYSESYSSMKTLSWEERKQRRDQRYECYKMAITNPLTKLTSALCGAPVLRNVLTDRTVYENILSGKMELYEYMLKLKFQKDNVKSLAAYMRNFQKDELKSFVKEKDIDYLITMVERKNVQEVLEMIGRDRIIDFLQIICGADPYFYDPEYIECMIDNTMKKDMFDSIQMGFHIKNYSPEEVICLSLRNFDVEGFEQNVKWKDKDENDYSRFAEFNLYPEGLKYLLFDIVSEEHKRYAADQVRLLSFLLVLAGNSIPYNVCGRKKVYRANVEFESDAIGQFCLKYTNKLKATITSIREQESIVRKERQLTIDNQTSQELFESDVHIPVQIDMQLNKDELFAEYSKIGLSKDCPQDEYSYWAEQYHKIRKLFIRYLREPRRAVKTAVKEEFYTKSSINDERALLMNEYQKEDVVYRLVEEEQNMVETVTTHLFNTNEYNKKMEEADKELRKALKQRMTREKTILVALVATAAYLLGFLPLIFGNLNTIKTSSFALMITGISIVIFLLVGFIFLLVLRHRLINRFKHFNFVMNGICTEIENSLRSFSKYLSHACNVMRQFSILNYTETAINKKEHILKKHQIDIQRRLEEIHTAFSGYITPGMIDREIPEPFEYDFCTMKNYNYDMPCSEHKRSIEFMQPGHQIPITVDYLRSITLTREEFYD